MAERLPSLELAAALPTGLSVGTTVGEPSKDPVFLVMFSGQIESAEVSFLVC